MTHNIGKTIARPERLSSLNARSRRALTNFSVYSLCSRWRTASVPRDTCGVCTCTLLALPAFTPSRSLDHDIVNTAQHTNSVLQIFVACSSRTCQYLVIYNESSTRGLSSTMRAYRGSSSFFSPLFLHFHVLPSALMYWSIPILFFLFYSTFFSPWIGDKNVTDVKKNAIILCFLFRTISNKLFQKYTKNVFRYWVFNFFFYLRYSRSCLMIIPWKMASRISTKFRVHSSDSPPIFFLSDLNVFSHVDKQYAPFRTSLSPKWTVISLGVTREFQFFGKTTSRCLPWSRDSRSSWQT